MFANARMRLTTLAFLACLLSGCISYEQATHSSNSESADPDLLAQIIPGETTALWLTNHLGQPNNIRPGQTGTDIWQYERIVSHRKHFRAIPLFAVELENASHSYYNFEVADQRVTRAWHSERY